MNIYIAIGLTISLCYLAWTLYRLNKIKWCEECEK